MDMPSTPRSALSDLPRSRSGLEPGSPNENRTPARAWRVRVLSDDYPGTLARFAIRLADLECRILGLTRHPAPGGVLDEFVLCPAAGLPPHLLIDALRDEGGDCLGMTEIAVPSPAATALAAEESIAEAAARQLLTPLTDTPAPDRTTTALPTAEGTPKPSSRPRTAPAAANGTTAPGAGAGEFGVPSATAFPTNGEPASVTEAGERRVPATTAPPVAGELCIGTDTQDLRAPATTAVTPEEKTGAEAGEFRIPAATVGTAARETAAETTVRGLRDPAATALVAARRAIADPGCRAPMLRTVLSADLVTLVPANEANPKRTEGGHRAVFSFGDGQAFVARRRWVAFAEPELAQAAAFLELLAAAEQNLAGPVVLDRPDGAAVVLRLGTPRDIDAIGAVHLRCSAKTLFNRYHTGLSTVPRKWLHRLLMPPRGTSLLAVCGRDVIGFGQLIPQLDGTAEVSLLVEDAWQRQGIGTALLARLAALAEAGGTAELSAIRLAGNDAMVRTAVRAGLQVETCSDDGTVLRLIAARTPRTVSGSRTSLCPAPRAAPASSGRA
ncbi:L-amino acid N-acyltransferase YncA [Amycolatopsis echigonensis]|uniref:L-amino acid N-acyltransferase YncA n=1 Tax=Amycolatopsis echigonensis TaxID=2576905 RepID=A0A2N3WA06_9PSEU|nr:GNAT family N-acetyltransferase [Amycolatopsis niigatensis]PKV90717.1 L-amino acid N-acyltransferase YncA [Amycolatopsis niigatensis]